DSLSHALPYGGDTWLFLAGVRVQLRGGLSAPRHDNLFPSTTLLIAYPFSCLVVTPFGVMCNSVVSIPFGCGKAELRQSAEIPAQDLGFQGRTQPGAAALHCCSRLRVRQRAELALRNNSQVD